MHVCTTVPCASVIEKVLPSGAVAVTECSGAIAGFGAFGLPNRNVEPWTITVGKDIGKGSVAFTLPVVIVHAWM